jgi:endoglucanase
VAVPRVVRILERLCQQPTASFHEHLVRAEAAAITQRFGGSARTDPHGNLIVAPPGRRRGPAIWLVAHMDHPGLEVTGRGEGRLLGGIGAAYLRRGVRLRLYRDGEAVPAHLLRFSPRTRRIRFGGTPESRRLRRGDFGVFELEDFHLARARVHARQLDDLAGCAVSLAAVERACAHGTSNVRALLTRAEEVGFVGTLAAIADGRIPRSAWIINAEASRAIPGVEIGGGPVIRVGDRASTFDRRAEDLLVEARTRLPADRPVQRALMTGGTCEATAWTVYGYRATGIAIPLGNYHNQGPRNRLAAETVAVRDLATAVDLVELAARNVPRALRRDEALRRRVSRYLREHGPRLRATRR